MQAFLAARFPTYGERNIKWFYIVSAFADAWFQAGNWLMFTLLFMSLGHFAVYEAISFAIGILLEIPSGAIADLIGRKRTVVIGMWMQAVGSGLFILGALDPVFFLWGNILIIAAFSLRSGSLEALAYDTLAEHKKTELYDDVIGKAKSLGMITVVVAGLLGGIAWTFSVYAPWVLTAVFFVFGALAAHRLREPDIDSETFSWGAFAAQTKRGFHYLFNSSFRKYTFSLAVITGAYYSWLVGVIRPQMGADFGYGGDSINYLVAVSTLAGAVAAYFLRSMRKRLGDLWGFVALLAVAGMGWLLASVVFGQPLVGLLVFLMITMTGALSQAWTSVILNAHVHSKDRATAISTLSFLVQVPYVVTVILFAAMVESGSVGIFYAVAGGLLLAGMVSYYFAERSDTKKGAGALPQKP